MQKNCLEGVGNPLPLHRARMLQAIVNAASVGDCKVVAVAESYVCSLIKFSWSALSSSLRNLLMLLKISVLISMRHLYPSFNW